MARVLCFESGDPTVLDPMYIDEFGKRRGVIEGIEVVKIREDHRLFLEGEFGGFRVYCLVTHTRPEVIAGSVRRISETHFAATLKLELLPNVPSEHLVVFRTPILPYAQVKAASYGFFPDAFEFLGYSGGIERFVCDLTFLTHYAEDAPLLPLRVRYIGIAKAANREAHDRLGEGHKKLQDILAEHVSRPSRQTVSVVLYRPSDFSPPIMPFPAVVETIEATMIQHFKPRPLNIQRIDFPKDSPDLAAKIVSAGASAVMNVVKSPKGTTLYSEEVTPSAVHRIVVPLMAG